MHFTPQRIKVFVGNFGSGKTEIALNCSIKLRESFSQVSIVDLDIVNPYFRSREVREQLESLGVKVVAPAGALAQADMPALPPEIFGVLQNEAYQTILDVGGDDMGATALARFNRYFIPEQTFVYMVVNPNRPFTQDSTGLAEIMGGIERNSRLRVNAIISNPNLGYATTAEDVIFGHQRVMAMAAELELPVACLAVDTKLAEAVADKVGKIPIFPLTLFMVLPWLKE